MFEVMNMDFPVRVRPLESGDRAFVLNSWLKSNRDSFMVRRIPNTIYYEKHHSLVEHLLATANTLVICDPDSPNVVYGYVCFDITGADELVLHYAYIKQSFRRMGLMRALLDDLIQTEKPKMCVATHNTGHVSEEWIHKRGVDYDPYRLFAAREVVYEDC